MSRKNASKRIQHSMQSKTFFMLFILLLFFCIVFLFTSYIIHKRTNDDYRRMNTETAIENVISYIDVRLDAYNYVSRLVMVDDDVLTFLRADTFDKDLEYNSRMAVYDITNVYSRKFYIDSVYIFRSDGTFSNTGRSQYHINLNSSEVGRILEAQGSQVISINGNGMIYKEDEDPTLTMSRTIYDISSGNLLGILVITISNNVFDEIMSLQQTDGIAIVDSSGKYLCGSLDVAAKYDYSYHKDSVVTKSTEIAGKKNILTGRKAVTPLVVLCTGTDVSQKLPLDIMLALFLMLFAFIVSILVCAWFISKNIARPITTLNDAMEKTKSSGWLKSIEAAMPDNEIGHLAESYNSMIDYLNELFNRLIEEEKNNQKAEMRVLQEQIKPHFLYNTLETISYIAVQENAEGVHDALETLGSFYRNFLSKGEREIPLRRELKITQDYLSLQKLRYGDVFTDEYDIDDATLDCMVPKLILQPLVENCIYHGVRLKGEPCIIKISTKMEDDGIRITVYDSGIGMSEEQIQAIMSPDKEDTKTMLSGFGLHGTINRIRFYCDNDNVVRIRSEIGEYTEIEIYIPRMRESREEN